MNARIAAAMLVGTLAALPLPAAGQANGGHENHPTAPAKAARTTHPLDAQPRFADLGFVDANGRKVALADAVATEHPVLVNFIFTTCTTICPVMSAGFSDVRSRLAAQNRGIRLVSISIDPEFDTPAKLKEYAARVGAGPEWIFLTGTPETVEAAERAFGAWRGSKEGHIAATFIRRSAAAKWERLDGLVGGAELLRAITADAPTGRH